MLSFIPASIIIHVSQVRFSHITEKSIIGRLSISELLFFFFVPVRYFRCISLTGLCFGCKHSVFTHFNVRFHILSPGN